MTKYQRENPGPWTTRQSLRWLVGGLFKIAGYLVLTAICLAFAAWAWPVIAFILIWGFIGGVAESAVSSGVKSGINKSKP